MCWFVIYLSICQAYCTNQDLNTLPAWPGTQFQLFCLLQFKENISVQIFEQWKIYILLKLCQLNLHPTWIGRL